MKWAIVILLVVLLVLIVAYAIKNKKVGTGALLPANKDLTSWNWAGAQMCDEISHNCVSAAQPSL